MKSFKPFKAPSHKVKWLQIQSLMSETLFYDCFRAALASPQELYAEFNIGKTLFLLLFQNYYYFTIINTTYSNSEDTHRFTSCLTVNTMSVFVPSLPKPCFPSTTDQWFHLQCPISYETHWTTLFTSELLNYKTLSKNLSQWQNFQ